MQYLTIGIDASSGELPKELGMLTDLKVLWASDNELTGRIPDLIGANFPVDYQIFLKGFSLAQIQGMTETLPRPKRNILESVRVLEHFYQEVVTKSLEILRKELLTLALFPSRHFVRLGLNALCATWCRFLSSEVRSVKH
ncbi:PROMASTIGOTE SURFACE ANTIGEN PROTEIN PSA [Salix koriyanagi]|uniref:PROMASTIGOTE SURFACE ANTIGEN PROTEIN PSA n=1 Tax=Salix koriyanagi TaxID=2511006 RepID=A0A9Q0UNQ8_9ROSI|nr:PROMASTIGOTE SURFACE ANTIGEN PROTEIN PSA [Salix koriyanagi]